MNGRYTISQLGHAAEVPTSTLRYYDRIGLVEPEFRGTGNYRLYSEESVQKVKFIRAAQSIGFTLDNIKTLLATTSCRDVQSLIEGRLAEVDQRLKDLRRAQRVLKASLAKCNETRESGRCKVIETLREISK